MMKIILTEDVEHLGASGSVHSVKDGFARNYLLPKKLAVPATPGALKQAAERLAAAERRIAKQEAEMRGLADRIEGRSINLLARVGKEGRLFGSVTAGDIAERLSTALGEEIDRRRVQLSEPIRSLGSHTVHVHLVGRLAPAITVVVDAENPEDIELPDAATAEPAAEAEA